MPPRAGVEAHLAEPAGTAAARGPKRRAKTDRTDARHLRELLAGGRLPESWIPPEQVGEMRARLQLFRDLREERTAWVQRVHAILLHQGAPAIAGDLLGADNRRRLEAAEDLSPAGQQAVATARGSSMPWTPSSWRCGGGSPRLLAASPAVRRCRPSTGSGRHRGGAVGRVRRHPPVRLFPQDGAPHRAGHHRLLLRRQAATGEAVPAGLPAAALGAVRSGQVCRSSELSRSCLLPAGRRPARRQPGRPLRGPQDHPASAPHPACPRRGGLAPV